MLLVLCFVSLPVLVFLHVFDSQPEIKYGKSSSFNREIQRNQVEMFIFPVEEELIQEALATQNIITRQPTAFSKTSLMELSVQP
jgi:hypothetical protein